MDTREHLRPPFSDRRALGRAGEDAAAAHVARLGWRVLSRNWRPADTALVRGELDIVADDGTDVVVCEVKTRRGTGAGDAVAGVTPAKLRQLRRLAAAWLGERGGGRGTVRSVRFDVIGVVWPDAAIAPSVTHVRDVRG